jgi:hypothetical protein
MVRPGGAVGDTTAAIEHVDGVRQVAEEAVECTLHVVDDDWDSSTLPVAEVARVSLPFSQRLGLGVLAAGMGLASPHREEGCGLAELFRHLLERGDLPAEGRSGEGAHLKHDRAAAQLGQAHLASVEKGERPLGELVPSARALLAKLLQAVPLALVRPFRCDGHALPPTPRTPTRDVTTSIARPRETAAAARGLEARFAVSSQPP